MIPRFQVTKELHGGTVPTLYSDDDFGRRPLLFGTAVLFGDGIPSMLPVDCQPLQAV